VNELISVIVPIYNAEKYLEQCVNSILSQTYRELEVLLIDDGSTDNSSNICDKFVELDNRVKVIHKKNAGAVPARKMGLSQAKGTYVTFVDADDWLESDMYEKMYTAIVEEDVDIVMCGRYEDVGDTSKAVYHGIQPGRYDKDGLYEAIFPRMIVNGEFFEWGIFPGVWDKLFKREVVERHQMQVDDRLTMGDDAACSYPTLLNADSIYILPECLYHYRQSSTSMVKQKGDVEVERMRFQVLYHSVMERFEKDKGIYDLREQWKEYVLFLMTPRADVLYEEIEELEYLFPFPNVKKGSRIILYGFGTYGQRLYRFLQETHFCEVVAVADRNYAEFRTQGFDVIAPEDISKYSYDSIVIAMSFAKSRKAVYKELSQKYGEEKVHMIDEELIKSEETMKAFGLI